MAEEESPQIEGVVHPEMIRERAASFLPWVMTGGGNLPGAPRRI
jgi:hypothetical protein